MKRLNILLIALLIVLTALLSACKEPIKKEIKGFAAYKEPPKPYMYKAVTPSGVILQVSELKNYPKNASLAFWKEAILEYLPKKGYKKVDEGKTKKGQYFVFLVSQPRFDYFYFVHYQIKEEKIILTESGGRFAFLKEYKSRLISFCEKERVLDKKL